MFHRDKPDLCQQMERSKQKSMQSPKYPTFLDLEKREAYLKTWEGMLSSPQKTQLIQSEINRIADSSESNDVPITRASFGSGGTDVTRGYKRLMNWLNLKYPSEEAAEKQQQREQQRRLREIEKEQKQQKKEQEQLQKQQSLNNKLQALQLHHQQRVNDESSFDISNDRTEVINGKSRRVRYRDELEKEAAAPTTLQASVLQLEEMLPDNDKQAKIMEMNSVLSSVVQSGITGKELARQLLEASGLDETGIDLILRRTPSTNGTVQVESLIRASPNWNDDYLVASVFTQHISQGMATTLYGELHKVKIDRKAPHIAMDQSRHTGITSLALAHLIYDIIESIRYDKCINLKVMITEALRIDERREAVFPILDMLEALKVERLILDSMGINERTWVEIQWQQRAKNRDVSKVASQKNAGRNVSPLSGNKNQRKTILDEAKLIKAILVKGGADDELCQAVDKAEKDGATFYENNEPIIDHNNDLWLKSLEDRKNDVSAEEAVETYINEVELDLNVGFNGIPSHLDYLRFSNGTDEDSKNQQSLNLAVGKVLCGDSLTLRRMIIKDVHKSRRQSGHLGLSTLTTLMCKSEVERVTLMDPARIGGRITDRKHQLENLKELARQTNTTVLFSKCHDQDENIVNDMEIWRQEKQKTNNDERKKKEEEVLPTDEQKRKQHGWFASIKGQYLNMMI